MKKIYIENFLPDSAITRICNALKKYKPVNCELAATKDEADFVVITAYGHRRSMQGYVDNLLAQGKEYAVVQLSVRSTTNPNTTDWLPIWQKAKVTWSYYDLPELCRQDGNQVNFNFYYAPLGADASVFKETKAERNFLIAGTGTGRGWNKECKNQIIQASDGKPIFQLGYGDNTVNITYSNGIDDELLAEHYSRCQYVSGLRRIEGFELPVLEGLLCGARPICFDKKHYKHWFKDLALYIPEDYQTIIDNLRKIFSHDPQPVSKEEKDYVIENFNWQKICNEFWLRCAI